MVSYVFYDDTDCGGIVYHANYLVFCERARSLLFFEKGMLPHNTKHGFVVKEIESSFIKTLYLGDKYKVQTTPLEIKSASLILKQEIFRIATCNTALDTQEAFIAYIEEKSQEITQLLLALSDALVESSTQPNTQSNGNYNFNEFNAKAFSQMLKG